MSEALYTQEQLIRARNENYAAGIQDERERIIKLLETDKVERQPVCSDADCEKCPAFERGFDRAIALIKDEAEG